MIPMVGHSRKVSLNKPPLAPVNHSMYQDSFDLLSDSHDFSEQQFQTVAAPRYVPVSSSGRDFKISSPYQGSHFCPASPPRLNEENDSRAIAGFSHRPSKTHDSFDLRDVGYVEMRNKPSPLSPIIPTSRSLILQRYGDADDYDWPSQKRHCCDRPWCFAFLVIFGLLFAAGVVLGSLYLAVKPKAPTVVMKQLNITSFKFGEIADGTDPHVSVGMRFVVHLRNPNKHADLFYDEAEVHLQYQDVSLGVIWFPGFKQRKRNETNLVAELRETTVTFQDPLEAVKMQGEVAAQNVQLDLRGAVDGHYKVWGLRMKSFDTPVDCKVNVKPEIDGRPAQLISDSCYQYST